MMLLHLTVVIYTSKWTPWTIDFHVFWTRLHTHLYCPWQCSLEHTDAQCTTLISSYLNHIKGQKWKNCFSFHGSLFPMREGCSVRSMN